MPPSTPATPAPAPRLLSPEFHRDPYAVYARLRADFPLHWDEEQRAWLVSRYVDVSRVFRDPVFAPRHYRWQLEPVLGRVMIGMEGREHALHRALVSPSFRGRNLAERLTPLIGRIAAELVEGFAADGEVDLVDRFCRWLPIDVTLALLGLDRAESEWFQGWYRTMIAFAGNVAGDPEVVAAAERARRELRQRVDELIARRRRDPGEDLVSVLCSAEVDGRPVDDDTIHGFVGLLLLTGGDSTDKALGLTLRHLLDHPDQLAAVRDDPTLAVRALAETLRYTAPAHGIRREATADVRLSGGTVPAGDTVLCLVAAANRDPERYRDPDRFDLFRDDLDVDRAFTAGADHLAFGAGAHFCVAAQLARAEVEIALTTLVRTLPDLAWSPGFTPVDEGFLTRGPASLLVRFTPPGPARADQASGGERAGAPGR